MIIGSPQCGRYKKCSEENHQYSANNNCHLRCPLLCDSCKIIVREMTFIDPERTVVFEFNPCEKCAQAMFAELI